MEIKIQSIRKEYWNSFNKFIKIIGYVFLFVGIYGFLFQAISLLGPDLFKGSDDLQKFYTDIRREVRIVSILVYAGVSMAGYCIVKAKPYFPKGLE